VDTVKPPPQKFLSQEEAKKQADELLATKPKGFALPAPGASKMPPMPKRP